VTPTLESEDVSKKSRRERRSLWTPPTPEDSTSGEADKWLEEILARAAAKDSSKTSTPSATKKTATKKSAPAAKKATASKTAAKKPGRTR
jgi:topoisomerase IA-like protein